MRVPVVVAVGHFASGCVAQPQSPDAIAAAPFDREVEPAEIVCKMEKPTGSNRPVKVCREVPGALDREQTKRDMNVLKRQTENLK
ncbi:MAG: hypothetical protein QNJ14_17430 [Woeseiaceae bacterium]|nr:hypothetical protein [Woeseiaceae bacterium]